MEIKVMTFNIQHCALYKKDRIDFKPFADEILSSGASVTGLNEVRGRGKREDYENQTEILSALTGMKGYFGKAIDVDGKNPYGNALLSGLPVISCETVKIPDPLIKAGGGFETRCIIKAVIDAGVPLNIFITHMGLNNSERKNAVKTLTGIIPSERSILMGDFNCTPEDKVLEPLYKIMKCTDTEKKTFPSDRPEIKIDYIFHTPDLELKEYTVHENVVSDHLAADAVFSYEE